MSVRTASAQQETCDAACGSSILNDRVEGIDTPKVWTSRHVDPLLKDR
jgi:hypothetical protein